MEFLLSLHRCSNSSCMHCELNLYIPSLNDHGRKHFYLLAWMVWCRLSIWWCCCIPSIVLRSAVSQKIYWWGVVYRWLLQLGPLKRHYPLYSLVMIQSIAQRNLHLSKYFFKTSSLVQPCKQYCKYYFAIIILTWY